MASLAQMANALAEAMRRRRYFHGYMPLESQVAPEGYQTDDPIPMGRFPLERDYYMITPEQEQAINQNLQLYFQQMENPQSELSPAATIQTSSANTNMASPGHLSLQEFVEYSTDDVTAATRVWWHVPLEGNKIALYDTVDGIWKLHDAKSKLSLTVPSTTNKNFDIFVYDDAGTLTLASLNWTSDSARATALERKDGIYTLSGNNAWRYLGSGRTTGVSGQTESSDVKRYLWNLYNRQPLRCVKADTTQHTYSSTTARQWNNDGANEVHILVGLDTAGFVSQISRMWTDSGSVGVRQVVQLDETLTFIEIEVRHSSTSTFQIGTSGAYRFAAGKHEVGVYEAMAGTGATGTFATMSMFTLHEG